MEEKRIVFSGHQPNFLPYMGYFYKMFKSDIFVLDDDVQYSTDAWHNTNFIRVGKDRHRITIPVSYDFGDCINQVKICYQKPWLDKFLKTVKMNYGKAEHFGEGFEFLERHLNKRPEYLCDLNIAMITEIKERFGLRCEIIIASKEVPTELKNNDRNVYQCFMLGGNVYYSGIGGKDYNNEELYEMNGIKLEYTDYEPVRYKQAGYGFVENLSVIDYILNQGFVIPDTWGR